MSAQPDDSGAPERPKLIRRLQERKATHKQRSPIIRALYVAVGITLLLAGLAMLIAPGPAFAVIPIGLFILALEFRWAESALEKSLAQAEVAKRKASETTPTQRLLTGIAFVLGLAGVVAWAIWGDIPLLPV